MANTKDFVPVSKISNDMVIMTDGSMAIVIQTSAVNFDLLSENEQLAIIGSFAAFLNSLSFSIQIVIRSKKLDISHYLESLRVAEKKQTQPLLQMMMQRYRAFVTAIIRDNEVLDKQFYIVFAVSPVELGAISSTNFEKNLPKAKNILEPRRDHILKQLGRIGLKSTQLDDERLIKLYYDIYNDEDKVSLAEAQANLANATPPNAPSKFQTPSPQPNLTPQAPPPADQGKGDSVEGTAKNTNQTASATQHSTLNANPSTLNAPPSSRPPLYSSSNNTRQAPFVVEELPA